MRAAARRLLGCGPSVASALIGQTAVAETSVSWQVCGSAFRISSRTFARGRDEEGRGDEAWGGATRQRKGKIERRKKEDLDEFWAKKGAAGKTAAAEAAPEKPSTSSSSQQAAAAPPAKVVDVPEGVTVRELSRRLQVTTKKLEAVLASLGSTFDSSEEVVPLDTAELAAWELGFELNRLPGQRLKKAKGAAASATGGGGADADLQPRLPVVAVMGHVDHGKTTLLDSLRKTTVAAGEAGGITQHMGAFIVALPNGGGSLTFLDTPGHAAFTHMRARGAACTDVAVLVVAADDGIMPQTREALAHARAAGCPIVVALTKCDKPAARPAEVRRQLVSEGVELEEAGGSVQCVEVSAVSGAGLEALSEALLLEADQLDLRVHRRTGDAEGVVLEAKVDRGQGALVTVLLRKGTLSVGSAIVAGKEYGRVRAIRDARGQSVESVGPSEPAEVSGLRDVPSVGDVLQVVATEERAKRLVEARSKRSGLQTTDLAVPPPAPSVKPQKRPAGRGGRGTAAAGQAGAAAAAEAEEGEAEAAPEPERRELTLIVKSDVQGTGEALRLAVEGLGSDLVGVNVVSCAVGPVTEGDVSLAAATGAVILAYNVKVSASEAELKRQGVRVAEGRVIYHILDRVGELLSGLAPELEEEEVAGEAEVLQMFEAPVKKSAAAQGAQGAAIAGCRVSTGQIVKEGKYRVVRGGKVLTEGLLDCASMRRHRLDVETVGKGTECGLTLEGWRDFKPGDLIQCIRKVKRKAKTVIVHGGGMRVSEDAGDGGGGHDRKQHG